MTPPSLPPQWINDIPNTHSEPLRLSEISPHKQPLNSPQPSSPANAGSVQDGRQYAVSPMRPAKKRVSTDADPPPEERRRKRGKTHADADSERESSNEAVSQGPAQQAKKTLVRKDQTVTHPETRDSAQRLDASKSTLPSVRTKYRPKLTSSFQCKGSTSYLSSSRRVHEGISRSRRRGDEVQSMTALSGFSAGLRLRCDKSARQEDVTESTHTHQRSGPTSTADLPLIEKLVRELH